jgi:hypothetical protein
MILKDVTATVSTRGRHNTTLPLVLSSLLTQNKKPGKVIIYDDNDSFEDPNKNDVLKNILSAMLLSDIQWYWEPGSRTGQVTNHERARTTCTTTYIWRIDDDNILLPNTLEIMYEHISADPKVGAVGPSIVDPKNAFNSSLSSNKMADIFLGMNEQWNFKRDIEVKEVEHLQGSTFMYRVEAAKHGYDMTLSRKGHREETIFTYEMVRSGWKLLAILGLTTWHFHYQKGGIRSEKDDSMAHGDEIRFRSKLQEWNVKPSNYKFFFLDSGRGDHYAFKPLLPELLKRHKDCKLIIACCYPDTFWDIEDERIVLCSLAEGAPFVDKDAHNTYRYMFEHNWKGSVTDAYKKVYL